MASSKRILLLHPNFPGQFRLQAQDWAAHGHDVRFLCQTHYGRSLPGVQRLCLKRAAGHEALESSGEQGYKRQLQMAKQYRNGFQTLLRQGWHPNLILSHAGWGCGLHASECFPQARRIGYSEWWFGFTDDPLNNAEGAWTNRRRNMVMSAELAECHTLVTPTRWQCQQLPPVLQQACQVLHDGVDLEAFHPNPTAKTAYPLLTYGTRGMEPTRKFDDFVNGLPAALQHWPDLQVEIAGEDRICYGGKPPQGYNSFGQWANVVLKPWINQGRVRFLGRLPTNAYRAWLQRSWVHAYLTTPYVASWSLLEAMASGCCLLVNASEPIQEFCSRREAWVAGETRDPGWIQRNLETLLASPELRKQLGCEARKAASTYSSDASREHWRRLAAV